MEPIGYLIDKLKTQYESGADANSLLQLVQMLLNELQPRANKPVQTSRGGVTVVMPSQATMRVKDIEEQAPISKKEEKKLVFELEIEPEEITEDEPEPVAETPAYQPPPAPIYTPPPARNYEPAPVHVYEQPPTLAYQPKIIVEEPIRKYQVTEPPIAKPIYTAPEPPKDFYNKPTEEKRSVNEALETAPKPELGSKLLQEPIKDLKRAITINDRYQFINHLFKGDETTYERSIKTINNFNVYSEAEFWIRRELAIKFSWRDEDLLVKQFNQLVSRRFM